MVIKIKFPLDNNSYTDARLPSLALFVFLMSFGTMYLDVQAMNSRRSIFLSSQPNMTLVDSRLLRNIPYDDCRCSVLSNQSNNSIKCVDDIQAMAAHILPLVSYLLQLYLIYELFSFTGNYSHILTDIFWIVALFVFVIIGIGVHGSSRLHSYTTSVICMTGMVTFGFVTSLVIFSGRHYPSCQRRNIYRDQRLAQNIMITRL